MHFWNRKKEKEAGNRIGCKKIEGPLVSVIIPLYNHEKFIRQAVQSVLDQTYQSWELIIIDDGSRDRSREEAEKFTDPRIRVAAQENAGAHNAINRGLKMARGDYLAVLNSDDVYEKDRLEIMAAYMEQHPEIGFVCSYLTVINAKGKQLGVKEGWRNMEPWLLPHPELSFKDEHDFIKNLIISNFTATTSNFFFRRRLYENIGGMRNLRFAHDWDFVLRAAASAECSLMEQPLLRYRVHDSNTISSDRKWMLFEIAWVWAANLKRFFGTELFKEEGSGPDVIKLAESLNLQGNDKIFWMILLFIQAQEKSGAEHAEEILLEDEELRKQMLEYVTE